MNQIPYLMMVTVLLFSPWVNFPQDQDSASASDSLFVLITGCKNDQGNIKIALCNSENNYTSGTEAFRGDSLFIRNRQAEIVFRNIPYGEYGIKIFHDENNDGRLSTGFLGIPVEVYGFSNNARGRFGPPGWSAVKFKFETPADSMVINLK